MQRYYFFLVYHSLFTIKLLYSFLCIFNELCTVFRNIISMINNTFLTHKHMDSNLIKEKISFTYVIQWYFMKTKQGFWIYDFCCYDKTSNMFNGSTNWLYWPWTMCIMQRNMYSWGGACLGFEVCCCFKGR